MLLSSLLNILVVELSTQNKVLPERTSALIVFPSAFYPLIRLLSP